MSPFPIEVLRFAAFPPFLKGDEGGLSDVFQRPANASPKGSFIPDLYYSSLSEVMCTRYDHACVPCLRRSGYAQAGEALQRAGTVTLFST